MDPTLSNVVAHRGLHGPAPENSLAAIQAAIDAGLSRIEVDVRSSADGRLFLLHDPRVERTTTGRGRLRRIDSAVARGSHLKDGTPLPRLEDALDLCRANAILCLDVKEADLGPEVVRLVQELHPDAEVWSPHPEVVARGSEAGLYTALISLGLFKGDGVAELAHFGRQLGVSALSFFPADLDWCVARTCQESALSFMCGTPNDARTWKRLQRQGARAIITDDPLQCAGVLSNTTGAAPRLPTPQLPQPATSTRQDNGDGCNDRKDSVITPS